MKLVRMVGMFCFAAMCAVGLVACGSENRGEVDQGTEIVTRTVVERAEPQGESGEETQTASGSSEESSGESSGEESSSGSSGSEGGAPRRVRAPRAAPTAPKSKAQTSS